MVRRGDKVIDKFIKVEDGEPMIQVDPFHKKISTIKGFHDYPMTFHPSNKRQFDKAHELVTKAITLNR